MEQNNQAEATTAEETNGTAAEPTPDEDSDQVGPTDPADIVTSPVGTRSRALLEEFKASAAELKKRSSELITRTEAVVALAATLDDIDAIVSKEGMLVREERCIHCNQIQGAGHKRGKCANEARINEIQARLTQFYASPSVLQT
jgi:hypothetical protein